MVTGTTNLLCLLREAMDARVPEADRDGRVVPATRDVLLILSTTDAETLLTLLSAASEAEKKKNPNIKNWY